MATSVNLGERLEAYVSELVETGRFPSRSAVLREAVRLVVEREQRLAARDATIARDRADALRRDIGAADAEIAAGLGKEYDSGADLLKDVMSES